VILIANKRVIKKINKILKHMNEERKKENVRMETRVTNGIREKI
jgi:hypothetical protein